MSVAPSCPPLRQVTADKPGVILPGEMGIIHTSLPVYKFTIRMVAGFRHVVILFCLIPRNAKIISNARYVILVTNSGIKNAKRCI